jgi:hypothetical protein
LRSFWFENYLGRQHEILKVFLCILFIWDSDSATSIQQNFSRNTEKNFFWKITAGFSTSFKFILFIIYFLLKFSQSEKRYKNTGFWLAVSISCNKISKFLEKSILFAKRSKSSDPWKLWFIQWFSKDHWIFWILQKRLNF